MQAAEDKENIYLEKVSCDDLRIGMYVQELDRPWLETPFLFQGFCIRDSDDIHTLRKCCSYVYINRTMEGDGTDNGIMVRDIVSTKEQSVDKHVRDIVDRTGGENRYQDTADVEVELDVARNLHADARDAIERVFSEAKESGELDLTETRKAASAIVDSVLRNPDAFMLLSRIKSMGKYRYTHAINSCAIAATFCRHLGFSKEEIQDIAMGAMLLDTGMTKMPAAIIEMQGTLNPLSMKLVRHHIDFGMEILNNTPNIPSVVHDMVMTHHERVSGEGYPRGLKGDQIPVCGRIAAIIDCYDAMTSNRPHRKGISQTEAICAMYNWKNIDFHEDLIEQFIQCIGAYPTGSLVELSSGQIGIVMSQNRVRRLFPKILLIMNADRTPYEKPHMLDLWEYSENTKGEPLEISGVVEADKLGIDPAEYYL